MSVLILVEGADDFHTIGNLIGRAGVGSVVNFSRLNESKPDFVIKSMDGYSRLRRSLRAELIADDFSRFAIVVDADSDLRTRWDSLTDKLQELQEPLSFNLLDVPETPPNEGAILRTDTSLTIGIWLWPNNAASGDMESFAGMLTQPDDPLWLHAGETITTLPETRFVATHRNKAHIHTWLAWQDPPGQQLGEAIRNNTLQSGGDTAKLFLSWLTKLKEITP